MAIVDAAAVRHDLSLGSDYLAWMRDLESVGAPPSRPVLPSPVELLPLLGRLNVPTEDVTPVLDNLPSPTRTPEVWWLLERCYHRLVSDLGGTEPIANWPLLPANLGTLGRLFYVYVFLATVADVRRWHHDRGVPDEISWATLGDLGRNMDIHRRIYGQPGVDVQGWLSLHLRGAIYQLGRLQFNRSYTRLDPATIKMLQAPFQHGDPSLGVHIPQAGPLTPEACDESFLQARAFFAQYFPDETYRVGVCTSWLLDEQLAEYLDPDSNIVRFQRRFQMVPGGRESDADVFRFVFRRIAPAIEDLPQRTTLERAIVTHLRSGGHWRTRTGWLEL